MRASTNGQITLVMLQRTMLLLAIPLGFVPLISIPFVALGGSGTPLSDAAMVFCGFTILPASVLAFWWRRQAACWVGACLVLVAFALPSGKILARGRFDNAFFYLGLPLLLTVLLGVAELFRWPAVLAKSNRAYAER